MNTVFGKTRRLGAPSCSKAIDLHINQTNNEQREKRPYNQLSTLKFSILIQLILFACLLTFVQCQIQFSSNEDKRNNFEREFLSFGKRSMPNDYVKRAFEDKYASQYIPFGKRYASLAEIMAKSPLLVSYEKKNFNREFLPFGKRGPSDFERDFMSFGRRK